MSHYDNFSNETINEWGDMWQDRSKLCIDYLGNRIIDGSSIVDFGCGKMIIKDMLGDKIRYTGVDFHDRGGNIIADLNSVTDEQIPNADIYIMLGVLEYLQYPENFVKRMAKKCKTLIVSYRENEAEDLNNFTHTEVWKWMNWQRIRKIGGRQALFIYE